MTDRGRRGRSRGPSRCSFCGCSANQVDVLVPGPQGLAICNRCVERAQHAIDQRRTTGDWTAQVAAADRCLAHRVPISAADARLLLDRAHALVMLGREQEALATLERVVAIQPEPGSPELSLEIARALLEWIQLAETQGITVDPDRQIVRIDELLQHLPADDMPSAIRRRSELLVEKALLLERAGREREVAAVLDEMVDRYQALEDSAAAQATAWALRNRIAAGLEDGRDQAVRADVERLRTIWGRAPVTEHVAAVWKLLMLSGREDLATELVTEGFDQALQSAHTELPVQEARFHLAALIEAGRTGDTDAADDAALKFIETLRGAPDTPELAEMLQLLRAEYAQPPTPAA